MANIKISQMSSLSSIVDSTELPVIDSGNNYKITALQLKNYAGGIDTGNITFNGDNIGSSNNIVNIVGSNYVELESNDSYIWVENGNAAVQVNGYRWTFHDDAVLELANGANISQTTDNAGHKTFNITPQEVSDFEVITIDGNIRLQTANSYGSGTTSTWTFNKDGNLNLPTGSTINETTSPSGVGTAIVLTPADGSDANQKLVVYPTNAGGEGNHLHLTTGNLQITSLFVGNDSQYVRTTTDGDITIGTNDNIPDDIPGTGHRWKFGHDGDLILPIGKTIRDTSGTDLLAGGGGGSTLLEPYKGFRAHYGSMYDNYSDPNGPINKLVIYKDTVTPTSTIDTSTSSDDFQVTGLAGSDIVVMLVVISDNVTQTSTVALREFVESVIDNVIIDGNTPGSYSYNDIATMKSLFYNNFDNFKSIIPSVKTNFEFFDGSNWPSNYINDGGNDEYDSANYINTNIANEISYNNGDVVSSSSEVGGGEYVVTYQDGIFGFFVTNANFNTISTSGQGGYGSSHSSSGFDGDGIGVTGSLYGSSGVSANTNLITNGTSYANVTSSGGNVVIGVDNDNMIWNFATDGIIYGKSENNVTITAVDPIGNGNEVRQTIVDGSNNVLTRTSLNNYNFKIETDIQGSYYAWQFNNQTLQTPDNSIIRGYNTDLVIQSMSAGYSSKARLQSVSNQNEPNVFTTIDATTTGANIKVYDGGSVSGIEHTWQFDNNGTLTVPGDVVAEEGNDLNFEVYNTTTGGGTGLSFVNYDSNVGQKTTQLIIGSEAVELTTNFNHPTGSKNIWIFEQNGNLTLPADGNILDNNNKPVIKVELPFDIKSTDFSATVGGRYGVDTTSNIVTATLPSSPSTGDAIYFACAGGSYSTHNLVIARNGKTIMGSASDMTVSVDNQSFGLFYNGTTWRVY